jgi:hypothetical protein
MMIADDLRLPWVDDPLPNLAMMMVGRALAETLRDTIDAPLPEPLARILREICDRKQFRGIATRYDKIDQSFTAMIHLTASFIALK